MYVSIPVENRVENRQPSCSGDIADDMVKLQVHLIQRFLHVLDMASCHVDKTGPMSQQRPDRADVLCGTEGCAQ
jgi:hypothetical protein